MNVISCCSDSRGGVGLLASAGMEASADGTAHASEAAEISPPFPSLAWQQGRRTPALHHHSGAFLNNSYLGRGGLAQPRNTIYTMSKKGPGAFTSTEANAGRGQVQVRVGFHATCFPEGSSWNELVSLALLLRLLWCLKALKLLNTLAFQPFTKRAPSHSAPQG